MPEGITDPSKTATCSIALVPRHLDLLLSDYSLVGVRHYRIIDTAGPDEERLAWFDIAVGHQIVSHRASSTRRIVRAVQVADMEQSGLRVRVMHLGWSVRR
jgi:hypothetical protein